MEARIEGSREAALNEILLAIDADPTMFDLTKQEQETRKEHSGID